MTLKFRYNDLESLRDLFDQYPNQIACVVMEAEATTARGRSIWIKSRSFASTGSRTGFRRDDHGLSLAPGRSTEIPRGRSSFVNFWQSDGKRVRDLGTGWQTRDHATGRPGPRPGAGFSAVHDPWRGNARAWRHRSKPYESTASRTWLSFCGTRRAAACARQPIDRGEPA